MNRRERHELGRALREMMEEMPEDERRKLEQQALEAHHYLLGVRSGRLDASQPRPPEQHLFLHSLLHDDPDGLLAEHEALRRAQASGEDVADAFGTTVAPDGSISFGGVDYDTTDPKWSTCLLAWWYTSGDQPNFVDAPVVKEIEDSATLAILGDWGGNNQAAQEVARAAKSQRPGYFIHLGDVYYNGYSESGVTIDDYQRKNFLAPWPGVADRSFNLNSNHDMYAHGRGYFTVALRDSRFLTQRGCSYFALYNASFRVVGLDTAYYDPDRSGSGFMIGTLNSTQEAFLGTQAAAAASSGQQLIILTHHNGLALNGGQEESLWGQVTRQLSPLSGKTVVWYWGHEHAAAVYNSRVVNGVTIAPRCSGHSCIPWGVASDLQDGYRAGNVTWFEQKVLGPGSNYFVTNGFAFLDLGSPATEAIYGQDASGGPWSAHWQGQIP